MSIDIVELDSNETIDLEEWLQSDAAGELQRELEEKILRYLFSNSPSQPEFLQIAGQLAYIGAHPDNRALLAKEIVDLYSLPLEHIEQCGIFKKAWKTTCKISKFVAEHKTEILIGAAICATGIGIAAITGYTLSASVGGVVVAGAGSIFSSEEKPNPLIPAGPPPVFSPSDIAMYKPPIQLDFPSEPNDLLVTAEGIWANGQFYSNKQLMEHSMIQEELAKYSPLSQYAYRETQKQLPSITPQQENPFASIPQENSLWNQFIPSYEFKEIPPNLWADFPVDKTPDTSQSSNFTIIGEETPNMKIGWINGINNSFVESKCSAIYLYNLANGLTISGIHNSTNGWPIDLLEAGLLNYNGYSPNTAKLLQSEWLAFHETNADNPHAKLLQICHSQGAIHVKNALENLPPEIQNRIIVVAIAPAAVVPKRLCFKSYNYASEKDIVYKLEPRAPLPMESIKIADGTMSTIGELADERKELILLKPYPEAEGIDHEFISPTYRSELERLLANYRDHEGVYLPEEKENIE